MSLSPGKIPVDILKEVIFKNLGVTRKEVAIGPKAGIDSAVIDLGEKSLVVSMDPITGAVERIGWLAVNVNANDIATFGVEPAFLVSCLMLPEATNRRIIEDISTQMGNAAKTLGMAIVGGHCEVTPGLEHPIVVGCAMGITEKGKYVTAAGAKVGDKLILTKSAGIEGTAILSSDREPELRKIMNGSMLKNAKEFYLKISVVKDALTAYKTGGVHAMHDPTEGGIAGGIHEMADASNLGAKVIEEKIAVQPETTQICQHFKLDPLQLISSGALLIAADSRKAEKIITNLKQGGTKAAVIGEFLADQSQRTLKAKNRRIQELPRPKSDQLWNALRRS